MSVRPAPLHARVDRLPTDNRALREQRLDGVGRLHLVTVALDNAPDVFERFRILDHDAPGGAGDGCARAIVGRRAETAGHEDEVRVVRGGLQRSEQRVGVVAERDDTPDVEADRR